MTLPGNMEAAGVIINKEEEIPEPKVFVVLYIFITIFVHPRLFPSALKEVTILLRNFEYFLSQIINE